MCEQTPPQTNVTQPMTQALYNYPLCQYQKCVGDGTPDERRLVVICIYMYICVCVYICICMYAYTRYASTKNALVTALRTSAGWLLYVYICIYVCVCIYVYVCMHIPAMPVPKMRW